MRKRHILNTLEQIPHKTTGQFISIDDAGFQAFRQRIITEKPSGRNLATTAPGGEQNPIGKLGPIIEAIVRREMQQVNKAFSDRRIYRYFLETGAANYRELDAVCLEADTPTLIAEIKTGVGKRRLIKSAVKHLSSVAELLPAEWNPKQLIILVNLVNEEEPLSYLPKGCKRTTFARISHINGLPKLGLVELEADWIEARLEAQHHALFAQALHSL